MTKSFSLFRVWFLLFFASLILGQFERLSWPGLPDFYFHEIALLLANLMVLSNRRYRAAYLSSGLSARYWWLVFSALALSLLVNLPALGTHLVPAGLYLVRLLLYASLVPVLTALKADGSIKRFLPYALPAVLTGLAFGGIIQYLVYPDTRMLFWLGWDKHLYRSIGTLFDPNFLGLLMVMGLFLTPKLPARWQWWYATVLAICLLLTYSRSAYVALIAGGFILSWKKQQFRLFLLGLVAFAFLLLVLPNRGGEGNRLDRVYSVLNRQASLRQALTIYQNRPFFGIGFNAYGSQDSPQTDYAFIPTRTSSPANSYLLVLATAGLVGFTAFGLGLKHVWLQFRADAPMLALWTAVLTHALFNNSLFYPWVMIALAVVWTTNSPKEKISPSLT